MSGSSSAAVADNGPAWLGSPALVLPGPPGLYGEYLFIAYDALEGHRMAKKEPAQKTVMKLVNDRRRRGSQQSFTWPQKGSQGTEPPTVCFD